MNREEMRRLQSIRLRRVVEHAYHNSHFYRKKMQEMGITPEDIHSIDDIVKLPFTVKQDLRDNYPFGLMAVPMSEIVRLHASSGTTESLLLSVIPGKICLFGLKWWHDV